MLSRLLQPRAVLSAGGALFLLGLVLSADARSLIDIGYVVMTATMASALVVSAAVLSRPRH